MLDHFTILTQGGLVLWSRSFTPSPSPVDSLIRQALIEERSSSASYESGSGTTSKWDKDGYTLMWRLANELELIFVVAYQRILQLSYVEELLEMTVKIFLRDYDKVVRSIVNSAKGKVTNASAGVAKGVFGAEGWSKLLIGWEEAFSRILRDLEIGARNKKNSKPKKLPPPLPETSQINAESQALEAQTPSNGIEKTVLDAQTIARNIAALKARQKVARKGGKGGGAAGQGLSEADTGSESDTNTTRKNGKKAATKWADSKVSAADLASYDYSNDVPSSGASTPVKTMISSDAMGKRTKSGLYEVADYAANVDEAQAGEEDGDGQGTAVAPTSLFASFMTKLSLSPKALTAADLSPALASMKEHLMTKNVAKDIADKVCEGVGKSLEGKKVSGYGATKREVKAALESSLIRILTPRSSTDLLLDIQRKKSSVTTSLSFVKSGAVESTNPYSITFVGVNGVGKSTNLSKVAFWLLQNRLRVLIAACDTFRSGAVEQLRVHVNNLGKLGEHVGGMGLISEDGKTNMVELYERGYGKDAAGIAKDAITYASQNGFDVVLIDTAGRMQDNEPLMRALAKLVTVNNPDKIVFVGEALAGNEAVDQLTKFNRSLRDFSGVSNSRGIDGMILTKFDTIDDKVGAALSMTYVTGQPILFVGTGQTYSDLRSLRVSHIVQALLA